MYACKDCKKIFKKYKTVTETHSLPDSPFEEFAICPFCDGKHIIILQVQHCKCCGARMYGKEDYCSDACKRRGEYLYALERKRKADWHAHPLYLAIKEVEEYNKRTGSNLSYGQYFALKV